MYVCMYACMHACMHVCMYVCMYVCVYVCMYYVCMYVRTYLCMHVCMHVAYYRKVLQKTQSSTNFRPGQKFGLETWWPRSWSWSRAFFKGLDNKSATYIYFSLGEFLGLGLALVPDVVVPEAEQGCAWSRNLDPNFCPGRVEPRTLAYSGRERYH